MSLGKAYLERRYKNRKTIPYVNAIREHLPGKKHKTIMWTKLLAINISHPSAKCFGWQGENLNMDTNAWIPSD